jgi:hypothetical protein
MMGTIGRGLAHSSPATMTAAGKPRVLIMRVTIVNELTPRRLGVIYGLCDPNTGELRYVGQTVRDPQKRLSGHLTAARRPRNGYVNTSLVCVWIRSLAQPPTIVILERDVVAEAYDHPTWTSGSEYEMDDPGGSDSWRPRNIEDVEREWIWGLFAMGYQLLNSHLVHGPERSMEMFHRIRVDAESAREALETIVTTGG